MEKFGNDTFKYNGKLYKVVKKEIGHCCSDTCPLRHELDGACGTICSAMYNQLKNPEFTYEDVVLVEVAPEEAAIKNDEIDYKALYEETISKLKIAKKNVGYYTFSEVIDKVIPEVAESEDERIRKELIQFLIDYPNLPNGKYCITDFFNWLEKRKEQKPVGQNPDWSEKDEETLKSILHDLAQNVIPDDEDIQWLKSLKDRMTWRPTEEQMGALADAIESYCGTCRSTLNSLYNNLKKL